ncbi:MAG: cysteine--tRNA ligase [Alphaproteobacteria bacterium]|nr:cysteine--tRNA ligase [Alphaproteobacteria bacterium]
MPHLHLYNVLHHKREIFTPHDPQAVTMYVCGPTVYDIPHIGNARSAVVFDVLYRLLCVHYGKNQVKYVRNITDVDDKINAASLERGISIRELTDATYAQYTEAMRELSVLPPVVEPRVTETMPEIITLIARLVAQKHAYFAEGHVLFDVASARKIGEYAYGKLSGRSRDDMIAGARVEIAPFKRDPADFVLWKPSPPELPGWDSPWGFGRPGWHIECSAMIERHLGVTIDLHGGGNDLIFPHHENECAQSACAHDGAALARFWVHNGMLTVEGQKMSKSLGNFVTVQDVLDWGIPSEALRYYMLKTHYRQPMDFSKAGLGAAWRELDKFYAAIRAADLGDEGDETPEKLPPEFNDAICDDLNTALAIRHLHDYAKAAHHGDKTAARALRRAGGVLGILASPLHDWFALSDQVKEAARPAEEQALIAQLQQQREEARRARNFAEADRLRDALLALGVKSQDQSLKKK